VPIRFERFHQAPDVHGLRTAAHGAVVIDKLQGSSPRNVKISAAMIASGKCKGAGPDLRAVSSALFLMDDRKNEFSYVECSGCAQEIPGRYRFMYSSSMRSGLKCFS